MLSYCYRGCWFGLTWCQDSYGGEESLFLLHHMELTDAFVEVEHGCHEFLWYTCRRTYIQTFQNYLRRMGKFPFKTQSQAQSLEQW